MLTGASPSASAAAAADLPHAKSVKSMAGTPQYMAPEMALPGLAPQSARADVYLVGAVLFEW